MAQTEFTGQNMTVTFGGVALEGVKSVKVPRQGKGAVEQLDATTNTDATYTTIPDPLGPKGAPKETVTVVLQDSVNAYGDNKQTKIAFNAAATLVVDMAAGTANGNTYTHTAMELTQRVTKIPLDGIAECTLTFEANSAGAWDSPA